MTLISKIMKVFTNTTTTTSLYDIPLFYSRDFTTNRWDNKKLYFKILVFNHAKILSLNCL